MSIGGWTYSPNFKGPASTPEGRKRFADTSIELVKNLGLDGIDIDWEYPANPQEAADYVELLRVCRQALDEYSKTLPNPYHFELTVASPCGTENYQRMDLRGMDQYLDFWNLMAYDYAGSWDSVAAHQANLYPSGSNPKSTPFSTQAAVDYYINQAGIAPNKIVIGMPLYGRAFENTDGPGTPYQGVGQGTWEQGVYDFKKLPLDGASEVDDPSIGASYCFNSGTRTFVSYDTVQTAKTKAEYIKSRDLGGAMWWESSADKEGQQSIIGNVTNAFGGPGGLLKGDNCITYPHTKYDNLKNGFPGQ